MTFGHIRNTTRNHSLGTSGILYHKLYTGICFNALTVGDVHRSKQSSPNAEAVNQALRALLELAKASVQHTSQ